MKFLNLLVVVLGLAFFVPGAAYASPDDFDGITVEAVELDDDSHDVTHEVEVPHDDDKNEHHGKEHEDDERDEHEGDSHEEESHEEDSREDSPEESDDHHAESSSDESVS